MDSKKIKLLSFFIGMFITYPLQAAIPLDGIEAVVNKTIITSSQVERDMSLLKNQLQSANMPVPSDAELKKQVLNQLIDMQLELQQAKTQDINVTDNDVNQAIADIAAQNNVSVFELLASVKQQGFEGNQYQDWVRDQLTIRNVAQKNVAPTIKISPNEVTKFIKDYQQKQDQQASYHLEGLLIPITATATSDQIDQAQKKAQAIIAELKQGIDFQTVALNQSKNGETLEGGDMGWHRLNELSPLIASQLTNTRPGDILGPIPSPSGFYVIQCLEKRSNSISQRHLADQYRIKHILVKSENMPADEAQAKSEQIYLELKKNPKNFAELAQKHSQDIQSAEKGGDLGWISLSNFPAEFAKLVASLHPGEISAPFSVPDGWEIIEIIAIKKVDDTDSYLKSQAQSYLYQQKMRTGVSDWLKKLRSEAYIKIYP